MMRSLYSGVAGLKTHQTKMDVIGNNIANVNTVGFKSSSVNFADQFYQTMSSATGADAATGAAGTNAKQIGLGSSVASITTNITEQGGTQTTNRALDVAINGDSFLIVKSAGATYFTKSGALNVDAGGTLYCTTNGATVQGWMATTDAQGNQTITKNTVQDLTVMSADNMYYAPKETSAVTITGNIDKSDTDLVVTKPSEIDTKNGKKITFSFYDELGQEYTVKMNMYRKDTTAGTAATATTPGTAATANYSITLADVTDADGNSIFYKKTTTNGQTKYAKYSNVTVSLGGVEYTADTVSSTGELKLKAATTTAPTVSFNAETGDFSKVTEQGTTGIPNTSSDYGNAMVFQVKVDASKASTDTDPALDNTFTLYNATTDSGGVKIDFSSLTQYSNSGVSNTSYTKGSRKGLGTGNPAGEMSGISIDDKGMIYGTYNNGSKKLLAQIAVATFANPSGLEAEGDSLFSATLNSGTFDGVGEDVSLSGSFAVGALEMSNVDLAAEFTSMITTQRGFQANSRIITTSDTMLEELVNLKR